MELKILDLIQNLRTPLLDGIMPLITALGNAGILWIVLTAILLLLPKTRKSGMIAACSLLADFILCNLILKPLVARPRPFTVNTEIDLLINPPADFSFPSGHTAAAFTFAFAMYFAGKKKWGHLCLCLAVLIAFSRMYLYVHYPTDVLGGLLVAIASAFIGYKSYLFLKKKISSGRMH